MPERPILILGESRANLRTQMSSCNQNMTLCRYRLFVWIHSCLGANGWWNQKIPILVPQFSERGFKMI